MSRIWRASWGASAHLPARNWLKWYMFARATNLITTLYSLSLLKYYTEVLKVNPTGYTLINQIAHHTFNLIQNHDIFLEMPFTFYVISRYVIGFYDFSHPSYFNPTDSKINPKGTRRQCPYFRPSIRSSSSVSLMLNSFQTKGSSPAVYRLFLPS